MFPPFSFVAICHELAMVGNTEVKLASSFLSSKRRATLGQTLNDTTTYLLIFFVYEKILFSGQKRVHAQVTNLAAPCKPFL